MVDPKVKITITGLKTGQITEIFIDERANVKSNMKNIMSDVNDYSINHLNIELAFVKTNKPNFESISTIIKPGDTRWSK